jgi:hypothetical protein
MDDCETLNHTGCVFAAIIRPARCLALALSSRSAPNRDFAFAAVVPEVRCQCGAPAASFAGLQSRQFPGHTRNAGTDQGLDAVEPEVEADQDRREGRQPRPLRRIPNGRGRHSATNVPGNFATDRDRRAAAAASACAGMGCSMVGPAFKSNRRKERVKMPAKMARFAARPSFGSSEARVAVGAPRLSCREA